MLNPIRNSDKSKTSTHYKAMIQIWKFCIANQIKKNIDQKMCEPSKVVSQPSSKPYVVHVRYVYMYMYMYVVW